MTKEETILKLRKFTQDTDWHLMEEMMHSHLAPLLDVTSIDSTMSNDQIASEVRGRQLTIKGLTRFLNDAKIINGNITTNKPTFR